MRDSQNFKLDDNEYCSIYYYHNNAKIYIHQWNKSDMALISDNTQEDKLPDIDGDTILIGFENNASFTGETSHRCYILDVLLQGVLIVPSVPPTNIPTFLPTILPTKLPSQPPTPILTKTVYVEKSSKQSATFFKISFTFFIFSGVMLCITLVICCNIAKNKGIPVTKNDYKAPLLGSM